jgi:integrase
MIVKRNGKYLSRPADGHGGRLPGQTFKTKGEAKDHEDKCKREIRGGTYVAPKSIPSFGEKAEEWFASITHCRPGTTQNYRVLLDNWLLPKFRRVRLDRINTQTCEKFRTELFGRTGECNTRAIIAVLGRVLDMARRHKLVPTNATDDLPRIAAKAREILEGDDAEGEGGTVDPAEVLNADEVATLLSHAAPGFDRAFLHTIPLTGMRHGEALSLRWSEVDLIGAKIQVGRTATWARVLPAKAEDGTREKPGPMAARYFPPKTRTSNRTIPIPAALVSILREWRLQCPKGKADLVFPAPAGTALHRSRTLKGCLRPTLRKAKLRQVTVHSLRHSFASVLIMAGAPVTEVQGLLGHSSAVVTLRVYSHWFSKTPTDAIQKLAGAILGTGPLRHKKDTLASDDEIANVPASA